MKSYVITIEDLPQSVTVAERCIRSAWEFGIKVERWPAFTPLADPRAKFKVLGLDTVPFDTNPYSRPDPCMSTFLSHRSLWQRCANLGEPILVLEHDAVVVAPIPEIEFDGLCNLGAPSFGAFRTPTPGLGPLTSKHYMPGAHAYLVNPSGAKRLLEKEKDAEPTDVFLHRRRFPWLQEYYPWPVVCEDSFSTIQRELGCKAKHNRVEVI